MPVVLKNGGTTEKHTFPRFRKRVAGHRLMIGEGTYDQPNIQMEFDALRVSKGVLTPDKFLGRAPNAFTIVVR